MPESNDMYSVDVVSLAERELAAFLRATSGVGDQSGFSRASDIWLHTMESFAWPHENFERFFRSVTVRAAAQLFSHPAVRISKEEKHIRTCAASSSAIVNPWFLTLTVTRLQMTQRSKGLSTIGGALCMKGKQYERITGREKQSDCS